MEPVYIQKIKQFSDKPEICLIIYMYLNYLFQVLSNF